jgi:hypothetical protein
VLRKGSALATDVGALLAFASATSGDLGEGYQGLPRVEIMIQREKGGCVFFAICLIFTELLGLSDYRF